MANYYVKAYYDWIEQTAALSDAERGRLFIAILEYARSGLEPKLDGRESLLFPVFKSQIDRDAKKAVKSAENGRMGGRPKTYNNLTKPNETYEILTKPNETYGNPNNKKIGKEENKKIGKEEVEEIETRATAAPALPFGLTDADITASLDRDQQIEQAARDSGLPFHPNNITTARDLANEYSLEWLLEAIKRASDGKAQTWGYVKGILRSWKERGGMDAENRPKPANDSKRVTAQNYTQRNYTDEELNSQTAALLREAMEL